MTFDWALLALKHNKKVWRKSWYVSWSKLQNHLWVENKALLGLFSITLKWHDYEADDWEEYPPKDTSEEVTGEPV